MKGLLLCLLLTASMGLDSLEALSSITTLRVSSGRYIYIDGVREVVIEAKGDDVFGYTYSILGRMTDGMVSLYISEPRVEL